MKMLNRKTIAAAGPAVRNQLGMTLIEIMIVLAIIAVVMGFLVGPKVIGMFQDSKLKTTRMHAMQFVEAHTSWSLDTGEDCPDSIKDLTKHMNSKDVEDSWGQEFQMVCGDDAPEGVPFGVVSKGPDKKANTEDDIKSWEREKKKKKSDN